jgi:hypothetical protein
MPLAGDVASAAQVATALLPRGDVVADRVVKFVKAA